MGYPVPVEVVDWEWVRKVVGVDGEPVTASVADVPLTGALSVVGSAVSSGKQTSSPP